jgi:hypothetical protein
MIHAIIEGDCKYATLPAFLSRCSALPHLHKPKKKKVFFCSTNSVGYEKKDMKKEFHNKRDHRAEASVIVGNWNFRF